MKKLLFITVLFLIVFKLLGFELSKLLTRYVFAYIMSLAIPILWLVLYINTM